LDDGDGESDAAAVLTAGASFRQIFVRFLTRYLIRFLTRFLTAEPYIHVRL